MFAIIFTAMLIALLYAISWITTVVIIKLITLCFGWTFSWAIATGSWAIATSIWLIIVLLKSIISAGRSKSK